MRADWIIVDGYNLLHRQGARSYDAPGGLAEARHLILRRLEPLVGILSPRITVVFDGRAEGGQSLLESSAVEALFSAHEQSADAVIERLVHDAPHPERILVVTSDRLERIFSHQAGAQTLGCADFEDLCNRTLNAMRRAQPSPKAPRAVLGDRFPDL